MALDPFLLEILVCPETKANVTMAPAGVLDRLNKAIGAGRLRNRGGARLAEPLEAALVRQDGVVAYPVRGGVPIMLVDEQLELRDVPE